VPRKVLRMTSRRSLPIAQMALKRESPIRRCKRDRLRVRHQSSCAQMQIAGGLAMNLKKLGEVDKY
jgi:hypothetical protein